MDRLRRVISLGKLGDGRADNLVWQLFPDELFGTLAEEGFGQGGEVAFDSLPSRYLGMPACDEGFCAARPCEHCRHKAKGYRWLCRLGPSIVVAQVFRLGVLVNIGINHACRL